MAIKVTAFADYLSTIQCKWRTEDHAATKFIKSIKGDEVIKGYAWIPMPTGPQRHLDKKNQFEARVWFGEMVVAKLTAERVAKSTPIALVPVPSSTAIWKTKITRFAARDLAHLIAAALTDAGFKNVVVKDVLRMTEAVPSASSGNGPRDPDILYGKMMITGEVPSDYRYVLVDDVKTSGGHIQAACAHVADLGVEVWRVIVAGRTTYDQREDPFEPIDFELDEYIPPEDPPEDDGGPDDDDDYPF